MLAGMSVVKAAGAPRRRLRLGMGAGKPERADAPDGQPDDRLPDGVLVAVAGDAEPDADLAVTAMYETQYCSLVRLAALLVRDVRVAEDVVQESFVAMHGAWSRLRDHDEALSYLRRSVVSRSRSVPRHPAVADETEAERSAVICAIRALPPRQREALVLRFYLDLPDGQIASAMGISRATVQGHTARGMAALQGIL
jgi:DNA-directed RNA polymerase specialized sigma24 family protein